MDFNNSLFTVGQFAKFNHISAQTLRYYDQIGLLKPSCYNEQTGYRYYTITQCATLDIISHMKSLKFSLKDIIWYLKTNDQNWLVNSLVEKQKAIEHDISHLCKLNAVINRKLRDYRYYSSYPRSGTPFIEVIPQRYIFKHDTGINYYYKENDTANYEYMLRVFRKNWRNIKSRMSITLMSAASWLRKHCCQVRLGQQNFSSSSMTMTLAFSHTQKQSHPIFTSV